MDLENTKLTNEDIEKIQSIIIEKIVNDADQEQTKKLNILLDKLGFLKSQELPIEECLKDYENKSSLKLSE